MTGETTSTNFPTASPLQAAYAGGPYDAFVAKVGAGCNIERSSSGQPKYVVVMAGGIGSSNPGGEFEPLNLGGTSYCNVPANLASVQRIVDYFNDPAGPYPGRSDVKLTHQLASLGAVILPYSYQGAYMRYNSANPASPLFHVNPYAPPDPGNQFPEIEAKVMDNELASSTSFWPQSRIIVVGHSNGGLVAQLWWYHFGRTNHQGVAAEFSLDSPISGVQDGLVCFTGVCQLGNVGPTTASTYFRTWFCGAR